MAEKVFITRFNKDGEVDYQCEGFIDLRQKLVTMARVVTRKNGSSFLKVEINKISAVYSYVNKKSGRTVHKFVITTMYRGTPYFNEYSAMVDNKSAELMEGASEDEVLI